MTISTSADVKAAARRVLEDIFPADDEAALVDAVTVDFVNHEAPAGTPRGPQSALIYMHLLARAFSDQRWTVHQVVAEDDRVVIHCTHSGRHTGDFFGLPATGREFAYPQMHIIRMQDGRGAEHWAVRNDGLLMRQLAGDAPVPSRADASPRA